MSSPLPPLCSFRTFDTGGFVAVILPFISTRFLPEERGTSDAVTDFRKFAVSRTAHGNAAAADGAGAGGTPTHHCVRLSWNGEHIHQICDPNDPTSGRTTGVVRAAVEEFF